MKNAHTPGPWKVNHISTEEAPNNHVHTFELYTSSENDHSNAIGQANARLIAAAPDMLNELQYISTCIGEHPDSADYQNDEIVQINITGKGIKDLFAAIQKATKQ